MAPKRQKVFLSYARSDRDAAEKIGQELRSAGFEVWDPDQEILPGADFTHEIRSALESAGAVVVLISPEAIANRSVSYEIEYALGAKHLRGRLIPVVLKPTKDAPWILESLESVRHENPTKTGRQIASLLSQSTDAFQEKARAR